MGTIAKVTAGGATHLIASTAYATCTTGSTTAAKVATIQDSQDFTLINGVTIHVLFDWGNSAEAPTLNVNNTGAKPIYRNASQVPDAIYYWRKQSMVSLTYSTSKVSTGAWYLNDVSEGNADWIASTGPTSILNKPAIPSTYNDVGAASAAHAHGSVTSDGKITDTGVTIANGDALVITDSSDSNKIKKSSITFGTSTTSFLANNGTWLTPAGGGGDDKVFVVTYDDTGSTPTPSADELSAAVEAGKVVFCYDTSEDRMLSLTSYSTVDGKYFFVSAPDDSGYVHWISYAYNSWDETGYFYLVSQGDLPATNWYGTCSTTASTAAKAVTINNFTLSNYKKGTIIGVMFTTANTAATPTLNINSLGASNIYVGNATPNATTNVLKWSANTMIYFMYDGSYWRYMYANAAASVTQPRGANTWYGTSTTAAITQAKTSTIDNFVLTKGALITINFSTTNTYNGKITLNINSTGAKDVYYKNAVTSSTNTPLWKANSCVTFVYSGSYYYIVNITPSPNDEYYDFSPQDQDLRVVIGLDPQDLSDTTDIGSALESIWLATEDVQHVIQVTGTENNISASTSGSMYFASMSSVVYQPRFVSGVYSDSTGGVRVSREGYYKVTASLYVNATSAMAGPSNYRHGLYIFVGTASNTSSCTEAISHVQLSAGNYAISVGPGIVHANAGDKIYLVYRPLGMTANFSPANKASYLLVEEMP